MTWAVGALCAWLSLVACDTQDRVDVRDKAQAEEAVRPPFSMRGDLEGLFLVWFDQEGAHTATKRSEIPEARRQEVRVDSLAIAPEQRLDPEFVYVADLRAPGPHGEYLVKKMRRDRFETRIASASPQAHPARPSKPSNPEPSTGDPSPSPRSSDEAQASVIIYGASWCGVCHSAAAWMRAHDVAFVEKDIERDPGAREEMMRKAQAAGVQPSGIPVIDVRGQLMLGFDPNRMQQLLAAGDQTI